MLRHYRDSSALTIKSFKGNKSWLFHHNESVADVTGLGLEKMKKRDRPIASNRDFDEMKIVFRLDDPGSIFVDHLKKFLRSCNF